MPRFILLQSKSEFLQQVISVGREKSRQKLDGYCHQLHDHFAPRVLVEEAVGARGDISTYTHGTNLPAFQQENSFPGNLWVSIRRAFPGLSFQNTDEGSEDMQLVPEGLIS